MESLILSGCRSAILAIYNIFKLLTLSCGIIVSLPSNNFWDQPTHIVDMLGNNQAQEWPRWPEWSRLESLFLKGPKWSQLQSLVLRISILRLESVPDPVFNLPKLMDSFYSPTLTEVVLELHTTMSITFLVKSRSSYLHYRYKKRFQQLERTLLKFPRSRIIWVVKELRSNRHSFWNGVLRTQFPELSQQRGNLFIVEGETGGSYHGSFPIITEFLSYLSSPPHWS